MTLRILAATTATILLAACGGGGGSGSSSQTGGLDRPATATLTAATAPVESSSDLEARTPGIIARTDSLIVSTLYGDTNHNLIPTYEVEASCSGTSCTWTERTSGIRLSVSNEEIVATTGGTAVLTKYGITMLEFRSSDYRGYGAWLSHSAFGVWEQRASATTAGITIRGSGRVGVAGGQLTGSRPDVVASWRGLMTGTPQQGADKGNILQGDTTLTYRTAGNLIDAEFSNIVNLDRRKAHSVTGFRFLGIPVSSAGTYAAGSKGNRIEGGIYGPGHTETAGIFERSGIVGAFGARRH
ncbi:MAG: hypothetical protein OXC10_16155 [Rhodospirillaceae bacterium]|nr:hypothetical protein [Rhodospirillaceae bacterium]